MSLYRVYQFRGYKTQRLRNILIRKPTVFWVQRGEKLVIRNNKEVLLDSDSLLFVPGGQRISIENRPYLGEYLAYGFVFSETARHEILNESVLFAPTPLLVTPLNSELRLAFSLAKLQLNDEVKKHCQLVILALLKDIGMYDYLLKSPPDKISDQLMGILSETTHENHNIEHVCSKLAMSRATLTRKLKNEKTNFRSVLLDYRMSCALNFLQNDSCGKQIHIMCGYESKDKFNKRFFEYYGISVKDYMSTVTKTKQKRT